MHPLMPMMLSPLASTIGLHIAIRIAPVSLGLHLRPQQILEKCLYVGWGETSSALANLSLVSGL